MPTLQRPHCDLYYEVAGEGPAVIFAHGAGGNHLSWWQQVPVFSTAYRCIAFDHRGWGRSVETAGSPGPAAFVDDLIAVMDELEIEQAALVAQSMGGRTCLGATVHAPERVSALIMADTIGGLMTDTIRPLFEKARSRLRTEGLATLAYDPNLRERDPALAFLYDEIMALNPPRDPGVLQALGRHPLDPNDVAALTVPILWIVGGNDPILPPAIVREAHAHVAGSQYFEVPATGHSVYFERAQEFNERVSAFLVETGWGSGIA